MHDYLPFIFPLIFIVLGIFMTFMPKQSVKKEDRDSDEAIKKSKRNGIVLIVISMVFVLVTIFIK